MKVFDNLFAGLGILALVIMFVLLVSFSGSIPVYVCFGGLLLYRLLIGTPLFIKKYYKLKGFDISWFTALIPYYNESTMMTPGLAKAYLVSVILVVLNLLLFLLPAGVMEKALGTVQIAGLDWYVLLIRTAMVLYLILTIIRGIAYVKIFIDIEEIKCELNEMKPRYGIIFILSSIIGFIPIARTFAIIIQYESLRKATLSTYLADEQISSSNSYDWNNY